ATRGAARVRFVAYTPDAPLTPVGETVLEADAGNVVVPSRLSCAPHGARAAVGARSPWRVTGFRWRSCGAGAPVRLHPAGVRASRRAAQRWARHATSCLRDVR